MVTKFSMRGTFAEMQPGETIKIPLGLRSYSYIRSCASFLGLEMDRKYTVAVDRAAKVCNVTRVA